MHHDVGDFEFAQIEDAAQHVAVALDHFALVVKEIHCTAQFIMARDFAGLVGVETEQAQDQVDKRLHGQRYR